ncbi:OmpH family outer membrane protein [Saprospira grandis]|uniref:OmpH family outer membrane protein n=1 Tax=Saprospira grandis TaxID=1008 RepID=UPI0022DE5BBD|nr:OmpH family outer membrane protein [Saprospira grandis]WBM74979.1 OmpH family outer membrane protein [Saprospira grandis]
MKKLMQLSSILMLLTFMAFSSVSYGQQKIAYVDADVIIPNMPEYKRAKAEVESYRKILEKQLEGKQATMQQYYADVMAKVQAGTMTPIQQKEAEQKLAKMQEDLQKQALKADEDLVRKEQDLTKPLYEKFESKLKEVAKENGYAYILDKKMLLYSQGGTDATAKLKAKLGI